MINMMQTRPNNDKQLVAQEKCWSGCPRKDEERKTVQDTMAKIVEGGQWMDGENDN
jgi:hypothetical protein